MDVNFDLAVLDMFFFYIRERERIRLRKLQGLRPPKLTADPILATYKFTNVLRHWDRTTQWVVNNWYIPIS